MRKKLLIAGLLGVALATGSLAVLNTSAVQYGLTADLLTTQFVTTQTVAKTPSAYAEADSRNGLLLTGAYDGAKAEFKNPFSGAFTLDYRTYDDEGSTHGLKSVRVCFTDKNNEESFFVEMKAVNGKRLYAVGEGEDTFSTLGYGESVVMSGDESDVLTFDPNTLAVSVNGETVWSFAYYKNGDYKHDVIFNGFAEYTVSVEFTDTASDGHMLVYALNGQTLDEKVLHKNVAAPTVYAPVKANGLAGEKFVIPTPYIYDVIDGAIASTEAEYAVWFGSALLGRGTYADGAEFLPQSAGDYTITYTVADSDGLSSTVRSQFTVLEEEAACTFEERGVVKDATIGKGGEVYIPRMTATSARSNGRDVSVYVDILRDGVEVKGATGLRANGFSYTFTEAGEYTVAYRADFNTVTEETSFSVTVDESLAVLKLSESIPEYVATGSRYRIPDGTLTFGEETVVAEKYIQFPSGATYTANYIDLTEYGNYKLTYRGKIGEVTYEQERWLQCLTPSNGAFTGDAVVESGDYERGGSKVSGVVVTQSLGKSGVTFSEPIDLSDKKKGDTLVEMAAMPFVEGTRDYHIIYITLTDINDPNNTVSIKISQQSSAPTNGSSYVKVSHSGLEYVGVESEEKGAVYRGSVHWGYYTSHSFCGGENATLENRMIKLSMDYEKKRIYMTSSYDRPTGHEKGGSGLKEDNAVVDLSSLAFYSEAWKGFSEDKCYVTIEAAGYSNSTEARYIIKSIDDYEFGGEYLNYSAPALTVDYDDNESVPDGVVGTKYPLFDAAASDLFGNGVKVYKNVYFTSGNRTVEVDVTDGAFTPTVAGKYTIVYRAADGLENTSIKTVDVNVTATAPTLTATVENDGAHYYTGTRVALEIPEYAGNLGRVVVDSVTAKCGDVAATVSDGAFVAEKAGTYVITYTVRDYLNRTATVAYEAILDANPLPVFENQIQLLPVYTVGQSYVLPELKGLDYSSGAGATASTVQVKATYGDGYAVTLGADRTFIPEAGHGNEVHVTYSATAASSALSESVVATAYVADYNTTQKNIKMQNYFAGNNVTIAAEKMHLRATVVDNAKPASFAFAKPLLANSLVLRMQIGITDTEKETAHNNAFNALLITLTDAQDPSVQITLKIAKNDKKSILYVNGGDAPYAMVGSFWGTDKDEGSTNDIQIRFSNSSRQIVDASGNGVTGITYDLNGNEFNGFPSKRVYVSFAFDGVESEGKAEVKLTKLNNQDLNNLVNDVGKPELYVDGDYGGIVKQGTEITLPTAYAEDVLAQIKSIGVTVTDPSNRTIAAVDGTQMNNADATKTNTIRLDSYGAYKVTYQAFDTNNQKTTTIAKILYVMKNEAVSYTVNGAVVTSAQAGTKITLPTLTTDADYNVIVLDPNFTQTTLFSSVKSEAGAEISFTPTMRGEYTVRYYVHDDYYNYEMKDFIITVS